MIQQSIKNTKFNLNNDNEVMSFIFYFIVPVWLLKPKKKQQIQHLEIKIANQEEIIKTIVEKLENAGKEKEADVEVNITFEREY